MPLRISHAPIWALFIIITFLKKYENTERNNNNPKHDMIGFMALLICIIMMRS